MTDRHLIHLSTAIFAIVMCTACTSTYGGKLGRVEVRQVVVTELETVRDIGVQPDFIDWSVDSIARTPAPPDEENLRSEVAQGFHRFVRAVVDYARGRGRSTLTAGTGRAFLRQSVKCGVIPCDTRKCCDFCRRLCTQKEPPPVNVAGVLTIPMVCPPPEP